MSKKRKSKAPPVVVVEEKAVKASRAPKKKRSRAPEAELEATQALAEEYEEVRPKG